MKKAPKISSNASNNFSTGYSSFTEMLFPDYTIYRSTYQAEQEGRKAPPYFIRKQYCGCCYQSSFLRAPPRRSNMMADRMDTAIQDSTPLSPVWGISELRRANMVSRRNPGMS